MKKAIPRCLARCSVVSRWQTCSKLELEALRQEIDVVSEVLRSLEEAGIGHHQRGGGVVEKAEPEQAPGALLAHPGPSHHLVDLRRRLQSGDLEGDLEEARGRIEQLGQAEHAPVGIEAAQERPHDGRGHQAQPDAMTRQKTLHKMARELAGWGSDLLAQPLSEGLDLREVVVSLGKEVTHALHRNLRASLWREGGGADSALRRWPRWSA